MTNGPCHDDSHIIAYVYGFVNSFFEFFEKNLTEKSPPAEGRREMFEPERSAAAAAGEEQDDEDDPDPVVVVEYVAQTVVHSEPPVNMK